MATSAEVTGRKRRDRGAVRVKQAVPWQRGSTVSGDEGKRIVPLVPQGDYTNFGYAVLSEDGQAMTTYMFQPGTVPQATRDPFANAQGPFPVDIHSGTCTDWVTEPVYDLGEMQVTNVGAPEDQEAGDTSGDVPEAAAELGPVYQVNSDDTDFDGAELVEAGPHVVAVHQSVEDYETLVACGNVFDFAQQGSLIVPLQPVGEGLRDLPFIRGGAISGTTPGSCG